MPSNPLFDFNTRMKLVPLPSMTKPAGGGTTQQILPANGILSAVLVPVSITIAGTLSAPNALGLATGITKITLAANNGQNIFECSGVGYQYLVRDFINNGLDPVAWDDGRAAVTAATFELDFIIPVAVNNRDQAGLLMLQNQQTLVTLTIQWPADAVLATGVTTFTAVAKPVMVVFEVPNDPAHWPDFSVVHQMLESQIAIPSAAVFRDNLPISGAVLGIYNLLPSGFTAADLVVQESNVLETLDADTNRIRYGYTECRDPVLSGALSGYDKRLFWDMAGSDGLGQYGTLRDVVNTGNLTSYFQRITPVGAQTLYRVVRQLLPLRSG